MKSLLIFLFITGILTSVSIPPVKNKVHKPYEATWMELTKTSNGFVVYKYSDPNITENTDFKTTQNIIVRNDSIIWVTYNEMPIIRIFNKVQNYENSKYSFFTSNKYQFEWYDKEKHIARWIIYYKDGERIMSDELYIDSLYNTYPIVDFNWEDE